MNKIIVKYLDNKPIFLDKVREESHSLAISNGCVQGPPCRTCYWHKNIPKCENGVYCTKQTGTPCP